MIVTSVIVSGRKKPRGGRCYAQRMVVLPALSNPKINTRISLRPKRELNILLNHMPIFVESVLIQPRKKFIRLCRCWSAR